MKKFLRLFLALAAPWLALNAATGREGASFLNSPIGAEPTSLGGAYSALAFNAYAPAWNPAGLGRITGAQMAAQYLSPLPSSYNAYLGFAYPFGQTRAIGATLQYLGTNSTESTDISGNTTGDFSSHYGAYGISYGQSITNKFSLGGTGKLIEAQIDDVRAQTFAFDLGALYRATPNLRVAGVVKNVGGGLKFLSQSDPLPTAFHLGGAYKASSHVIVSLEGVYRLTAPASLHTGVEWKPFEQIALRAGYRTNTPPGQPLAGLNLGIGFNVMGQRLSYAWAPLGNLGETQNLSLLIRFK